MSLVYIIENVNGKNFLPAKEFGDLRIILTGKEDLSAVCEKFSKIEFTTDDYLLLVGSPLHIALAGMYFLDHDWPTNVLVWNRDHYRYDLVKLKI